MSGFVGLARPRVVLLSDIEGAVLDALMREESADENEEDGAASLLQMVFLVRGIAYRCASLLLRGGILKSTDYQLSLSR